MPNLGTENNKFQAFERVKFKLVSFSLSSRMDDLKQGTLIGEDSHGNKYFQNNKYFYGEWARWQMWVDHGVKGCRPAHVACMPYNFKSRHVK